MSYIVNNKKQLLDPIGSMCHIVSLIFKPINTKIGIYNHALVIQEHTMFQWFDRYWNGDNRENISLLFNIVIRVIEWYVVPLSDKYNTDEFIEESKSFNNLNKEDKLLFWKCLEKMCRYMALAFERLQVTYHTGIEPTNVVTTIQYYINILNDSLDGKYSRTKLPKCLNINVQHNLLDYNKIKTLWTGQKLEEVCKLYECCFIKMDMYKKNIIKDDTSNLNNTLNNTLIQDINFDVEKSKYWKEIAGYIKTIYHFLDIYDDEFRELIMSSNEG